MMNKHLERDLLLEGISDKDYYIAMIDGAHCGTVEIFLKQIGKAFKFPSYYGENLNALRDCLNDLEWIDKPNYILLIKNCIKFLNKEQIEMKNHILDVLSEVANNWANVPNYEGEDLYRKKTDFIIKLL